MDWVFPHGVRGWLSETEGRKLAELAAGKRVLEIGSYCGRSAICMAQTAAYVACIDPFDGRGTTEKGDTSGEFSLNIDNFRLSEKVTAYRGTTGEVAPEMAADSFDLVFIDGAHDFNSVALDVAAAERLLKPGGLMAFHDYRNVPGEHDGGYDPDVKDAVDTYVSVGAELLEIVGTIAIVKPPRKLASGAVRLLRKRDRTKPLVHLVMPSYDGNIADGAAKAFYVTASLGKCDIDRTNGCSSFLTKTFNDLWCAALNRRALGVTHFAMIHADLIPEAGWVDTLIEELIRLDADMVSTVVPIKTDHGWTSTALAVSDDDPWLRRRLTMKEVFDLPETFGAEDVGAPLLLNTGLWVCRLDRPWCEQVCFDVMNRLVKHPDGTFHAEAIPEDWLFSQALNQRGCKLYATRKVKVKHKGTKEYSNDHVWGTQDKDEVFLSIVRERMKRHAEDQVHETLSGEGCDSGGQPVLQGGRDPGRVGSECAALR